jgi:hypothetical protein
MLLRKNAIISSAAGAVGWWNTGGSAASVMALTAGMLPYLS